MGLHSTCSYDIADLLAYIQSQQLAPLLSQLDLATVIHATVASRLDISLYMLAYP